jgi:phage terminase small subunit
MALTPKQEAFANAVASGKTQADAYRAAFKVGANTKPESVVQSASKLMADPNISSRVAELRKPVAEIAQITLKTHLEDLLKLRNMAAKEKQYSAAIAAEIARGKASGVAVEELKLSGKLEHEIKRSAASMTDDELAAIANAKK